MIQLYRVKIRQSTIPGAGKGVFAVREFEEDESICPCIVESITQNCLDQRYDEDETAPYAITDRRRRYIDSACRRGIGSMANGRFRADGTSRVLNAHNAVVEPRRAQGRWLRATKPIAAGGEIFVYYGDEYVLGNNHTTRRTTRLGDTRPC